MYGSILGISREGWGSGEVCHFKNIFGLDSGGDSGAPRLSPDPAAGGVVPGVALLNCLAGCLCFSQACAPTFSLN